MALVDFSQVEDAQEPVPAGWFECALEKFQEGDAQSSGEPIVTLTFTITEGEYAGRRLYRTHSLQSNALWALKRTCLALGASNEDLQGSVEIDDLLGGLIGAQCQIKTKIVRVDGEPKTNIATLRAPRMLAF